MSHGPSDPPRLHLQMPTGPLAYTDEGSGHAIVAVHGLPGSARDFRYLAPHISGSARFIRLDLPGFGETPVATGPALDGLGRGAFVLQAIEALGLDRPLLLGHSMGGLVCTSAAFQRPDIACGLALISSPGLRPHAMIGKLPYKVVSALLRVPGVPWAAAPALRRMFAYSGFRGYPDPEILHTLHLIAKTNIYEHGERASALRLPTLVSWCQDDAVIEGALGAGLAEACPPGPRLRFEEGGHNPQKTHAAALGAALVQWLQALKLGR